MRLISHGALILACLLAIVSCSGTDGDSDGGGEISTAGTTAHDTSTTGGAVSTGGSASGGTSTTTSNGNLGGTQASGGSASSTGGTSTTTSNGNLGGTQASGGSASTTGGTSTTTSNGNLGGTQTSGGSASTTGGTSTTGGNAGSSCDGFPSGSEQQRMRYAAYEVPVTGSCNSEIQIRSCSNGAWSSWSGTFTAEACSVCKDIDGDRHGDGCLAGPDCDDASASCSNACRWGLINGPDGDSDGAPGSLVEAWHCPGTSPGRLDCNDEDPAISPNAAERPWDFVDNNCDGKLGPHLEAIGAMDCFSFNEVHATNDFVVACDGLDTSPGRMAIREVSDLSHPYSPITPVPSCKFAVAGNVVVVHDYSTHELVMYPIPAAGAPLVEAARYPAPSDPAMVLSSTGDRVYLSQGDVVDISDPLRPHAIGTVPFQLCHGEEVGRRLRTSCSVQSSSSSGGSYWVNARVDDATDPTAIQPVVTSYFSASSNDSGRPTTWAQSSDTVLWQDNGGYCYRGDVATGALGTDSGSLSRFPSGIVFVGDTIWTATTSALTTARSLCSGWMGSSCTPFSVGNATMDRAGSRLLFYSRNAVAVVDVTGSVPKLVGSWGTVSNNEDGALAVADSNRAIALGSNGLAVLDLSIGLVPRGGTPLSWGPPSTLAVLQSRALVLNNSGYIDSVDYSSAVTPSVVSWVRSYPAGVAAVASGAQSLYLTATTENMGDLWTLRDAGSLSQLGASAGAHPPDGAQNWAYHAGRTIALDGDTAHAQYWEVNGKAHGLVSFSIGATGLGPQHWIEVPGLSGWNRPGTLVARNGLVTYLSSGLSTLRADTGAVVESFPISVDRLADDGKYTFARNDFASEGGLYVLSGSTLPRTLLPVELPAGYKNLRGHFAVGSGVIVTGAYLAAQPNACMAAMRIVDDGG